MSSSTTTTSSSSSSSSSSSATTTSTSSSTNDQLMSMIAQHLYNSQMGYFGYNPATKQTEYLNHIAPPQRPMVVLVS